MPGEPTNIPALRNIATQLRIDSVLATTEAGSGHPTSCCSAADVVAALFFAEMHFDPKNPQHPRNDRFVLSKGHAAPLLYAAWAESGAFDRSDLLNLRKLSSDLEGHPTPRLPFVDVATGSLGQGICAAIGISLNARRLGSAYRTYVLLGDGETAEGSVWESAHAGTFHKLDNLCVIVDVNRLGQSRPTPWGHDVEEHARHWRGFGWHVIVIDGHDMAAILGALEEARNTTGIPTAIVAKTLKGKGVSIFEGKEGWHGKALKKGDETNKAIAELEKQFADAPRTLPIPPPREDAGAPDPPASSIDLPASKYKMGEAIATREAFGKALAALGHADRRVVALDADVKNSSYSEFFEREHPDRFYEFFIAEQVMVGAGMGFAARGAIPFPSTFACFLYRAADFIRMAGISDLNMKLAGSHSGVSIGEDGPSQMALEDLAMMRAVPNAIVLYPCDAVSTERLMVLSARHKGMTYMRTSRPKTPVVYEATHPFEIGGCGVLRQSANDVVTVVGAGVTVFEALKAHDELAKSGINIRVIDLYCLQPVDAATLLRAGRECPGGILTVEDHYPAGGVGDAVSEAVSGEGIRVQRLAVREIPRSGAPEELLDRYGISTPHIVEAVRALAAAPARRG